MRQGPRKLAGGLIVATAAISLCLYRCGEAGGVSTPTAPEPQATLQTKLALQRPSPRTRPAAPASRPDRQKVREELDRIGVRIRGIREQAEQTEAVKKAEDAKDKIWWRKGNEFDPEFEAGDKRIRQLREQIEALTKERGALRKKLSAATRKIGADPEYRKANTALQTAKQRAYRELAPDYDEVLAEQLKVMRMLSRSEWPKAAKSIQRLKRPGAKPGQRTRAEPPRAK